MCVTERTVNGPQRIVFLMLEELLTTHRLDLIKRCGANAAARNESSTADADLFQHGVPLFLDQLVDTLRNERQAGHDEPRESDRALASAAIGRAAALHGADLLLQGYDIEQVVREYGDVCQAVTAVAVECDAAISANDFRTLNRCLDDAIADAVHAFADAEHQGAGDRRESTNDPFHAFLEEHRRLIDIALRAHAAILTGQVGIAGATGNLLNKTLLQMQSHAQTAEAQLVQVTDTAGAATGP